MNLITLTFFTESRIENVYANQDQNTGCRENATACWLLPAAFKKI